MDKITIRRPDDLHVHLRDGDMLTAVLPYTAKVFGRALVMPNLTPPVLTDDDAKVYRERILARCVSAGLQFDPLMTIKIIPSTTPETIHAARRADELWWRAHPELGPVPKTTLQASQSDSESAAS